MKELNIKILLVDNEDFIDEWGIRLKIEFLKNQDLTNEADLIVYNDETSIKCRRIIKDTYKVFS